MAAITLWDIMSQMDDSPEKGVLMTYLADSEPLRRLPLETKRGGVKKWNLLTENPYTAASDAYRNFNAEFGTTKVKKQPFTGSIKVAGGRFEVDELLKYMDPEDVQTQMAAQIAARSLRVTKDIFEGAGGKGLVGIKQMIDNIPLYSGQVTLCGTAGTPAAITKKKINIAMANHNVVPGQTVIYMNSNPYLKLSEESEGNVANGYNIIWGIDQFGKKPERYDGIPVVVLKDGAGDDILSNTNGVSSDGTCIYIVTYGDQNFTGFQVQDPTVKITQTNSVLESTMLQWALGTAAQSIRCISYIDEVLATYS